MSTLAPLATAIDPTAIDPTAIDPTAVDPTVGHPAAESPDPAARRDLHAFVHHLSSDERCAHWQRLPSRGARPGQLDPPLDAEVLARLGVAGLWSHQAEALHLLRQGRSVVVATGTASGKSLCYQAAIAERAHAAVQAGHQPPTALLVFPTKALARDQLGRLSAMALPGVVAGAYDGDTGPAERARARREATAVLTNPEMLHHGILPHHDRWQSFLRRLELVVIDELHILRGVFGAHTAHVLRRLQRLCAHYGSRPVLTFSSATIGAPEVLATALAGHPVEAITGDGSPRGERLVVPWNPAAGRRPRPVDGTNAGGDQPMQADTDDEPPDNDAPDDGRRGDQPTVRNDPSLAARNLLGRDAARLTADLVRDGHHTITFCRGRRSTELVAAEVRRRLPQGLAGSVRPYRGGFLPEERRQIERELFSGGLRAVVATSALELGIDIGGLDASVLDGFPGTIASMWQQAGRSGRGHGVSLCLLVAGADQLDQWVMAHPTEVFERPPEPAVVNVANPFVLLPHLRCAAYELPLTSDDDTWWPDLLDDGVRTLVQDDSLRIRPEPRTTARRPPAQLRRGRPPRDPRPEAPQVGNPRPRAVWAAPGLPSHGVGLRGSFGAEVRIVTAGGRLVGTVDAGLARSVTHPGAVYVHDGTFWRVIRLDLDDRLAVVERADGRTLTRPRSTSTVAIRQVDRLGTVGHAGLHLGTVEVVQRVVRYHEVDARSGRVLAVEPLDLPPTELVTRAFWLTFDPTTTTAALHRAGTDDLPGALHAVEHAAIGMLPLFTICDRWDVGGLSTAHHPDTGRPTIVIHDGHPGGAGVAELGFEVAPSLLAATAELVAACACRTGCPSCIQSPKCGNGNDPLDKVGAVALLEAVLGR